MRKNEAFARVVIDEQLKSVDWNITNYNAMRFDDISGKELKEKFLQYLADKDITTDAKNKAYNRAKKSLFNIRNLEEKDGKIYSLQRQNGQDRTNVKMSA